MANTRLMLWIALAAILYLNYEAWTRDYREPAQPSSAAASYFRLTAYGKHCAEMYECARGTFKLLVIGCSPRPDVGKSGA